MANTEEAKEKKNEITEEDTRLDKKVKVRSIAPWITGAPRVTSKGDISIPANGSVLLSREEVIAQAQNGNKLLSGIDSLGSHATWYIEDAFTRSEVSFDIDDKNITCATNVAKISVVGAGMESHPGTASKMFEALYEHDINIDMISTSEIKISVLIDAQDADRAVAAVHKAFYPELN